MGKKFNIGAESTVKRVTQFRVALASVLTGHKMQGRSMDHVILGDLVGPAKYGSTGYLYVVLSRVRTLRGLFTLTLLDPDPKRYKARIHVIREMERLREIEEGTLARLRAAQGKGPPLTRPLAFSSSLHKNTNPSNSSSHGLPNNTLEKCGWSTSAPPPDSELKLPFTADNLSVLTCGKDKVHLCGPVWASRGYRNSCAIDTILFSLFVWRTFHGSSMVRPGAPLLEEKCVQSFLRSMAVLRKMLAIRSGAYLAWASAKHLYWRWMYQLNGTYAQSRGSNLDWVRFHAHDNYMNMWSVLEPTLQALGRHTLTFTRVCPDCKASTEFTTQSTTHEFLTKLLFQPRSAARVPEDMNTLIMESIRQQTAKGNDTCPHCFSAQYGSLADLGFKRHPADSITGARLTELSGQFFVRFVPGSASHSAKALKTPIISSELKLLDETLHLHTIFCRPNRNHFTCLLFVPEQEDFKVQSGWHHYDGYGSYLVANARKRVTANAKSLSKMPALNMDEVLGLCYSILPVPAVRVKTFAQT